MLQIVPASNPNALIDLDNIFSDEDLQNTQKKKDTVKSLGDITNEITTICKLLKEVNLKYEFHEINFIPADEETPELRKFMKEFEKSHDPKLFTTLDRSKFSQNIQLQISLLQSTIDTNITFTEVPEKIDTRISSLLHWKISAQLSKGEKCYHQLHALINYCKTPEPAPISVFFLEYNISCLIYQFCQSLVSLFSESPFLSPVIENLSVFSNDPKSILSLAAETEDAPKSSNNSAKNNSDDDDFDDLKPMIHASAPPLIKVSAISFENPLDTVSDHNLSTVKIPEGPSPVTYRFFRNKPKSTPEEFSKWLRKHHSPPKKIFNYSSNSFDKSVSIEKYAASNVIQKSVSNSKNNSQKTKETDEIIDSLLTMVFDVDIRSLIPSHFETRYFSTVLPIFHQINCTTNKFFLNDNEFKDIIENEYQAHIGCTTKDQKKIESSMHFFQKVITSDLNQLRISPLTERRQFPSTDTDIDESIILLMKLIDYSIIAAGYSPISLLPCALPPQSSKFTKEYLAQSLYYIYTRKTYPPYISFRAAFAIGILISEKDPSLACNFIYEAIFLLLHFYPVLNYATFVQSAFFEMGCLFNLTSRYYFCCMSMDNAIILCQNNHSLAGKAASMALKNLDAVRAVYYYLSAIKLFIASHQKEEFLYTARLVVTIYVEHDLINEAIQLTSYILKVHDKLDSINSVNTAAILCRLYCSKCNFEDALSIANSIDSNNPTISRIASKLKSQIFISQNRFNDFYEIIKPNLTLPNNVLPALMVTKETLLPSIKSLSKAYISKEDFVSALFWSEIGCHISSHISANKETPNFFLLRGYILYFIYYKMFTRTVHFLNSNLDSVALVFGKFINENATTKTEILREALSSLTISINLYERSGNVAKLLYAKSIYLQLICSHILLYRKAQSSTMFGPLFPISKDDMPLYVKKPVFYTSCKVAEVTQKTRDIDEIEIKSSDQFTQTVRSLQGIADSYYDPFYISFIESISSVLFYLQNDDESASITFDLALENIRKFFFKGTRFIVSNCKIWMTFRFVYFIRFLLSYLMEFPSDFIRDRLFLFDMMNDISLLLNYQKNTTLAQVDSKNEANIDFTASLCNTLDDSIWPKFSEIPISNERMKVSISQKMFSLYEQIYKNESTLSDDQISSANKKLITKIIGLKKKQVVPEFSIPDHSVYVFLGNGEIVSFIPSLLEKKYIPTGILRKPSFVEGVINMIDWNLEIIPFTNDFMKSCLLIGKALFGKFDFFKQFSIREKKGIHFKKTDEFKPPDSALVVISDHLVQFLPYEFFFPTISLIRRFSSRERENHTYPFRPIIFRNENKQEFLQYRRKKIVEFFTFELPTPANVIGNEGNLVVPFPIFNPNKISSRYLLLYSFFDIVPLYPSNLPNLHKVKNPLFILTFSDLVLMPDFLFQLIDNNLKACFVFIPASHISVALFEIKKIYDNFMIKNSENNKTENGQPNLQNLKFTEKFTYMTTLQMTLMRKLRIPIAIISPNRNIL